MGKLVFDIETIGENFDSLDEIAQGSLTHWIEREANTEEEREKALGEIKDGLCFSPLTGQIVAIGVYDVEKDKGAVYFQAPDGSVEDSEDGNIKFRPLGEKEMLQQFWNLAEKYDEFISFNGRTFDVPFLFARSAINEIRPSKNLMANRYLSSQPNNAKHIDLLDQLTYYGAVRRKGNLHLWARAFGIKSPKGEGISGPPRVDEQTSSRVEAGDQVGKLFQEKKFFEIAKYNVGDLRATKELYQYWEKYLKF